MSLVKCYFCGKECVRAERSSFSKEFEEDRIKKERKALIKKYGYVRNMVGKIGEKNICYDCLQDITDLIEISNNNLLN